MELMPLIPPNEMENVQAKPDATEALENYGLDRFRLAAYTQHRWLRSSAG
jgi:hypothetical protein